MLPDGKLVEKVVSDSAHHQRLEADNIFLRYYLGDQEILYDTKRENRNRIVLNHCARIIDTSVAILKGYPLKIVADEEIVRLLNIDDRKATSIVRNGSLFGNAYALIWFDEANSRFDFTELLDTECYPIYSDVKDEIVGFIRYYIVEPGPESENNETVGKAWLYKPDMITYLEQRGSGKFKVLWRAENPLGEIPVIQFRNRRIAGELLGRSDLEGIKSLQDDYNCQCSNESDILDYHGYPQLVARNLESVEKLSRGVDQIINIVGYENSDIKYLERNLPTRAFKEKMDRVKTAIHYLTGTPEVDKNLLYGNISGITLNMLYRDAVIKVRVKSVEYREAFEKLFKKVIRAYNRVLGYELSEDIQVFFELNTPEHEYEKMKQMLEFYNAKLISKQTMMELNPYISDIEREKTRLQEEEKSQNKYSLDSK